MPSITPKVPPKVQPKAPAKTGMRKAPVLPGVLEAGAPSAPGAPTTPGAAEASGTPPELSLLVPPQSALQQFQTTSGVELDQGSDQDFEALLEEPEWSEGKKELLSARSILLESNRALATLTDEIMMGVRGSVDAKQVQNALAGLERLRSPVQAQTLDQLRADASAKVAQAQAMSAMMGRDLGDASALSGLDAQSIVFRGEHEGKALTPEVASSLQHLIRWSQGVMEEAYLTPELPLQEMLQEPLVGVDELSGLNLATQRVMSMAREIRKNRPDAPVGPPPELMNVAAELRDSPPVRLEPTTKPVQLPAVEDVTAAHAPTISDFEEDPVSAALRQSRVVSVLSSATPHEVGRLVATRPDALTFTDDPEMASSVGYPVVADEEGRVSIALPSSSSWDEAVMVEATDLSKTGLPDAGWKFVNGQGPVRFKLEGKTLLVDQEETASSGAERMQEMMQANARESFVGPDIADDPVRFLRGVQELFDKGPLKKVPASNLLENIEVYIRAHESKAPTMELAKQLSMPGSRPHEVGKELARSLQDWALIGSMLESAKNVAKVAASLELPNRERFPTAVSVRNGETPEGVASPAVSMGLEGSRSPAEWFQQVYAEGVEVPGSEGLGVYDFSTEALSDTYRQFGFKPIVQKGVPKKLLQRLAESESGGRILRALKEGIESLMETIPPSLTSIALGHPGTESTISWEETEVDGWMLKPGTFAHNVAQVGRPAPRRGRGIQFNPVMMLQANIEMMNDSIGYLVEEGLEIPVKVSSGETVRLTADKGSAGYQEVLKHLMVDTFIVTSVHEVAHSPMDAIFYRHDVEHDRMMELVAEVGEEPLARMRAALMKELEDGKFIHEIHGFAGRLPAELGLTASGGSVPILPETISLQPGQGRAARGARVGDRPLEVPQVGGSRGAEARIRDAGLRGGLEASEVIAPQSRAGKLPFGRHPSGFYRQVGGDIKRSGQQQWSPEQLKGFLRSVGLKDAEMRWLGVDHLLKGRTEPVSKDELLSLVSENEVVLEEGLEGGVGKGREVTLRLGEEVVGQARFLDRVDEAGRTLVLSEVTPPMKVDETEGFVEWATSQLELTPEAALKAWKTGGFHKNLWRMKVGPEPVVPFEGRLHEVVAKKALRYAAENGYDGLEWSGAEDVGGFLEEYAKTNQWKVREGRLLVEQVTRSLEAEGQPLEEVAPAMAERPTRRELALGHMETGQGWSRKKKLFQSLTPSERFRAMQIRLAGGDFGGTWDKGGKFSWKALNPRKWHNTKQYPKYFGEWVPEPEQMDALQKLWDARGIQLEKAGRLAGLFDEHLEKITRQRKAGGSPYLEVTLDDLLEVGEHLDTMSFRGQIEWSNHVLGLYSAPEKSAEWVSVEPEFRNIMMDVFNRGVSDGPVPTDLPMDSTGWRIYSSARQRASGLRAHVRLLTRPGHALGPWNQVGGPEDFRGEVESGNYDRSIYIDIYKSKLTEQEEIAEAVKQFGPLTRAAEHSPELNKALFMAMNLQQEDFGLVDLMKDEDAVFHVKIPGVKGPYKVDMREWAPKLRKFLDGVIEKATKVEVERYTLQKATHHWGEELLREEKQVRELKAAQADNTEIKAWGDISKAELKKVRRSLSKQDDGDPGSTNTVWLYGMPVRIGTRHYRELSAQHRQAVAEWQRADEMVQELESGKLYRRGYFPWMQAVTMSDIQHQLRDPYGELSRAMTKEARNHFLDARSQDAIKTPLHDFKGVWPVYLKVMMQHIHSERAYRKALRRINTLPPWQQHYLRNWIGSMRHQDMPIDKIMNQTAQRQMMLEPHLMDEFVRLVTKRNPKDVFKEMRAKGHMSKKMASKVRRNFIMLTYFSLLGPIGIPLLNVTEVGFLAHEFLKGPLDMFPRVLPRSMRKLPGGKYLPTVNEEGKMSGGPAWWVAKGFGQEIAGGSKELLSAAMARVKNVPQWYSRPSMKGALSMIHEFYGDMFKDVGDRDTKVSKLIKSTSEIVFSLLKGTEHLLRGATMHAIENQLRHHWPDISDEWLAFEAVRRTNDLHAAFGATDQSPFVRGWPMDMWMPFHRWQWGKIEKMVLQGGASIRTALGAPMLRGLAKLRGKEAPTKWPPEVDRAGMGMAPSPDYGSGDPPPPSSGGTLPPWTAKEWETMGEWDAPNPNYGDSYGVREDVAWRHLWAVLVGGTGTLAFFRMISGFMFTDEWEEGTLFNRLNPFDVRYWKEISSLFWWDDMYTVVLDSAKHVTTGLNAREVGELQKSWQRLMWIIPFAGRVIRHKEQEIIDMLKALERDKLKSRHLGVPAMYGGQQERDMRTALQQSRPASKIMEHLYGISAGTRRAASDLDRMGLGGNLVTPGLRGLVQPDQGLDDALYSNDGRPARSKRTYGEGFGTGDDLD